jgi:hypothetical protein
MNPPPPHEPVSAPIVSTHHGDILQTSASLRRYPVVESPGFAVEVSDLPEPVYLLGRPDGAEVPVPCRVCGQWNPATLSGRHFFYAHEPDAALDLTSVRRVNFHIGRLVFPSGWMASPWFAAGSRRALLRQLHEFTSAFLEQRLTRSHALSRAIARERRGE